MSINFRPLTRHDLNFANVIDLNRAAFPGFQRVPPWILQYKMGKGSAGSNVIYDGDTWIGFIYSTEYADIVFVQVFAISETCRSSGHGGKVLGSMRDRHAGKRMVLNVEEAASPARDHVWPIF